MSESLQPPEYQPVPLTPREQRIFLLDEITDALKTHSQAHAAIVTNKHLEGAAILAGHIVPQNQEEQLKYSGMDLCLAVLHPDRIHLIVRAQGAIYYRGDYYRYPTDELLESLSLREAKEDLDTRFFLERTNFSKQHSEAVLNYYQNATSSSAGDIGREIQIISGCESYIT